MRRARRRRRGHMNGEGGFKVKGRWDRKKVRAECGARGGWKGAV